MQGVNFRRHTESKAEQLGVKGWVRNLPDSRVEGCFEGDETAVKSLVEWCRTGPAFAKVETLELKEEPFTGEFEEFRIRY